MPSRKRRVRPAPPRANAGDTHELLLATDAFEPIIIGPKPRWDDDEPDPEATTYPDAEHGPTPVPDWVITEAAARQRELGRLKSGKEADVDLIERTCGDRRNQIAAKRYRDVRDRLFRNDAAYRGSHGTGDARMDRAMRRGTYRGMAFRADQWASHEFTTLSNLWTAGAPVPYPIQRMGTEVLMQYLGDESAAPRLVDARPSRTELVDLCTQAVDAIRQLVDNGVVHADLSAYNTLTWDGRLFIVDFPQAVHPKDPAGLDLLQRDVENLFGWFAHKGAPCDPGALYAELVARVFSAR